MFIAILGSTCEDPGQLTIIEGRVRDIQNDTLAKGASIMLWGKYSNVDLEYYVESDAMGNFILSFFNEGEYWLHKEHYAVRVISDFKFQCGDSVAINIGTRNWVDLKTIPKPRLLKLDFVKQLPLENADSVNVEMEYFNECHNSADYFYSQGINLHTDSTFYIGSEPNTILKPQLSFYENGDLIRTKGLSVEIDTAMVTLEIQY